MIQIKLKDYKGKEVNIGDIVRFHTAVYPFDCKVELGNVGVRFYDINNRIYVNNAMAFKMELIKPATEINKMV